MKTKHTPGPWQRLKEFALCEIPVGSDDMHVATILCIDISEEEAEANARLVAAAPELLALAKYCATHNVGSPLERRAQRLIAKVEGMR